MQPLGVEDLNELRKLNDDLERIVNEIILLHIEWTNLRLLLIQLLSNAQIKNTLSWENKLIELRTIYNKQEDICKTIDDFLMKEGFLRQKQYKKDQIEEKIKSLKKIMDVTPQ